MLCRLIHIVFLCAAMSAYGKLLHRELVSSTDNPIKVCFNEARAPQGIVDALLPTIRFNLNLSGLIKVESMNDDCRNIISILQNASIIGTHSIEVQFHGPAIGKLPAYKIPIPSLNDRKAVNRYANKITRAIHEYLTHHRGWHDRKIAFIETININGENHYNLKVSNIDGSESRTLFSSTHPLINPAFSPDSKKIAITELSSSGTNIYIKEGKDDWERVLQQSDLGLASSWSPDSRHLLIIRYNVQNPAIVSYDTLSETTKQIMPGWSLDCDPIWPLKDFLYLTSSRSGSPQIYRFQLDSKLLERITFQGDGNQAPSISKDGSTMTYVRRIKDEYQLIVHHPKKGTKHQKLLSSLYLQDPQITDDGSWILFSERQGRRNIIGLIDSSGQTHIRMIALEGQFNFPVWVPESWSN